MFACYRSNKIKKERKRHAQCGDHNDKTGRNKSKRYIRVLLFTVDTV